MGVNWSEGLKGASRGLEGVMGVNQRQIDIIYNEVSEANRQRWASQQAADERGYRTSERIATQEFETPFKEKALELREEEIKQTGSLREATLALQGETARATQAFQQATLGINRAELDQRTQESAARVQQTIAKTAQEQTKIDSDMLEKAREVRDSVTRDFMNTDPDSKAKAEQQYQAIEEMLKIKPEGDDMAGLTERRDAFTNAYDWQAQKAGGAVTDAQAADMRKVSRAYADMTPEQRQQTIERRNQLIEEGRHPNAALGTAINEISGGQDVLERRAKPQVEDNSKTVPEVQESLRTPQASADQGGLFRARGREEVGPDFIAQPDQVAATQAEQQKVLELAREIARREGVNLAGANRARIMEQARKEYLVRQGGGGQQVAAAP